MPPLFVAALILALMFLLLVASVPIGFAMGIAGMVGMVLVINLEAALALLGQTVYETAMTYNLSVFPMFLLMGSFATSSGLSEALFRACHTWLGHRRGGLALATIGGCGVFAAICGSSIATAATMTRIALPDMQRYDYDERLATGAIAAGGTLGILIPPSVILVLYGILTESNIGDLFLAGVLPGCLLVLFFMITVALITRYNPTLGPHGRRASWADKLRAVWHVWGAVGLFLLVMGGMYLGVFTPTEAASIGAMGACGLGVVARRMSLRTFVECCISTVRTTAMLFTILMGAMLFNNFLVLSNVPDAIGEWVSRLPLSAHAILAVILVLYLVLGCALDALAMLLLTVPIFFPVVTELGFDPIWFGVLLVLVVELALITPPIGMNVFVIKGLVPAIALRSIYWGVLPFVIAQLGLIILLVVYPVLATWLPATLN